jgi:glycosyltransferase involved in cell wall biosynthesis
MRISLIISTYNRPAALAKVMRALIDQHRRPDEILIADDGSDNDTRRCIAQFRPDLPAPVTHVWQPDQGFRLAQIRNKAIRACRGDYLIFLDGDCVPEPHFVQDHERLAAPGCFFQGKRVLVDHEHAENFDVCRLVRRRWHHLLARQWGNRHHILRIPWWPPSTTIRLGGVRGCNMAMFKSDLHAVNGFNEDFEGWGREDTELVVRLYRYGLKRREHPFAAVCYHLWHPEHTRGQLSVNDDLLQQTLASDAYRCVQGIETIPRRPCTSAER